MEFDERAATSRQTNLLEQTTSSALNSTNEFLVGHYSAYGNAFVLSV